MTLDLNSKRCRGFSVVATALSVALVSFVIAASMIFIQSSLNNAKATRIVDNMKTIRSALVAHNVNNSIKLEDLLRQGDSSSIYIGDIIRNYVDEEDAKHYVIVKQDYRDSGTKDDTGAMTAAVFVKYSNYDIKHDAWLRKQFAGMAEASGIWNAPGWDNNDKTRQYYDGITGDVTNLYMQVYATKKEGGRR